MHSHRVCKKRYEENEPYLLRTQVGVHEEEVEILGNMAAMFRHFFSKKSQDCHDEVVTQSFPVFTDVGVPWENNLHELVEETTTTLVVLSRGDNYNTCYFE